MEIITTHTNVYPFEELEPNVQEKTIENLYNINTDFDWYEFVFDDLKTIGKFLGFTIENIYFSGFSSQGDGACFEGIWRGDEITEEKLKEHAPTDTELHRITDRFTAMKKDYVQGYAKIKHSGHYCHRYETVFDPVEFLDKDDNEVNQETYVKLEEEIKELSRDLMAWTYRQLEENHDYLTSKEAIIETIKANEYRFTENGKIFN